MNDVAGGDRLRRVLMVAFHYPPMKGSSGLQRTLNFTRHLPALGWAVRLLTVQPFAYPATSDEQLADIPPGLRISRLPCLDAARHLALRGKYADATARPDRWASWVLSAVPAGWIQCLRWKPHVIWSTFPIATAVVIGRWISSLSGTPWVLDLRDSMTEDSYPADPRLRARLRGIESRAVHAARAVVFTSPGARRMYAERYPEIEATRWAEIPNGFDEGLFRQVEADRGGGGGARRRMVLLHSGLLDPVDRNPFPFFDALARLKARGICSAANLRIILRATGHDSVYGPAISELGIGDLIELQPAIDYADALREMIESDGLLVFQAANCNHQTPAKIYEYLRAGRSLLALTDRAGDTAEVLRAAGFGDDYTAPISDPVQIEDALSRFLDRLRAGIATRPDAGFVRSCSRESQSGRLADVLSGVLGP